MRDGSLPTSASLGSPPLAAGNVADLGAMGRASGLVSCWVTASWRAGGRPWAQHPARSLLVPAAGRDRERALGSLQRHRQSCQPAPPACLLSPRPPPPGLFCLLFPLPSLPTDREDNGFQAEHPQEESQDGREAGFSSQLVAVWQPPAEGPWVQDVPRAHPDLQQSSSGDGTPAGPS